MITRNKTPSKYVCYGLDLYFSGLSLRRAAERLSYIFKQNHVSIWNWIQKYQPQNISSKKRMISEYIIDETLIKVGSHYIWLWVAIEPKNKQILALTISIERNMLIAEKFISGLVKIQDTWKTFGFNKWWNILPSSLHVLKPRSPHSFQLREKYY